MSTLRRWTKRVAQAAAAAGGAVVVCCAGFVALPIDETLLQGDRSVQVLARDGTVLATGLNAEGARALAIDVEGDFPVGVAAAFVAVEDRRFYDHHGIDVRGVVRAVKDSVRAGRVVSGASTLTQQLARRLGKRRAPGVVGKVEEALWALRLEAHLDKDQILRAYLERVPLGRNTIGVEAAARTFFGTRAALLSTSQAALLAGMAHAPEREDPLKHPAAARRRRDEVLQKLKHEGAIDDDVYDRAVRDDLGVDVGADAVHAPHLATRLRNDPPAGAVVVETTLDPALQAAVEQILDDEVVHGPLRGAGLRHAAVLVVDNTSGDVLAWAGSADFFDDEGLGKNDGVTSQRQPGSALKPFVYGKALEQKRVTPGTVLADVDTAFAVDDGGVYTPQNYDRRQHGPVTVRMALQNSYNVPAIAVAAALGADTVKGVLNGAGFDSLDQPADHYGVGLVLGNGEVTLWEMATAYRGLARGGVRGDLVVVKGAKDEKRNSVPVSWGGASGRGDRRFLDERAVALLTHILQDDAARAPAFGLDNALDLPFPVAAKTGTSRSYVDNWTAGFTHERTVAVWAGSFDGAPMKGVSGISGAGVVFRRVMIRAMQGIEPAALVDVDGFEHARICPLSGHLAGAPCPAVDEVFLPGTAPTTACEVHGRDGTLSLPGPLAAWAQREGLPVSTSGPAAVDAPGRSSGAPGLLSPRDGDSYALEPGVPDQQIPLRTVGVARVVVDGADFGGVDGWVDVDRGAHVVVAYDAAGAVVDRAAFTVY